MKILYAANNNISSKYQLLRFLEHLNPKHQIKIAAYKQSAPNIHIDWQLDCLLHLFNPSFHLFTNNDNLEVYYEQIKSYQPDLIISDNEPFTSFLAPQLETTIWQVSSLLLNHGIKKTYSYNVGLDKKFAAALNNPLLKDIQKNIIANSDKNLVYSHFGDLGLELIDNFQWVRPYHQQGKLFKACQHDIVSISLNHSNLNKFLFKYKDVIIFSDTHVPYYPYTCKNLDNKEEYYCNLFNSKIVLQEGYAHFLADCYYNNRYTYIVPNFQNKESIINSLFSEFYGLGTILYEPETELVELESPPPEYRSEIKYLHEIIETI